MLRDAAVLHLEILLAALDDGVTMKDGYAFNVQWRGAAPVFIDIGSFERLGGGGPWVGYRQFCQTFLYPLLLAGAPRHPLPALPAADTSTGSSPTRCGSCSPGLRRFRKGVFRHVYLHSVMEARTTKGTEAVKQELRDAGFGAELTKATVTKLLKLVRSLRSKRSTSGWADYRGTCSYTDEDREAKQRFVRQALEARPRRPRLGPRRQRRCVLPAGGRARGPRGRGRQRRRRRRRALPQPARGRSGQRAAARDEPRRPLTRRAAGAASSGGRSPIGAGPTWCSGSPSSITWRSRPTCPLRRGRRLAPLARQRRSWSSSSSRTTRWPSGCSANKPAGHLRRLPHRGVPAAARQGASRSSGAETLPSGSRTLYFALPRA